MGQRTTSRQSSSREAREQRSAQDLPPESASNEELQNHNNEHLQQRPQQVLQQGRQVKHAVRQPTPNQAPAMQTLETPPPIGLREAPLQDQPRIQDGTVAQVQPLNVVDGSNGCSTEFARAKSEIERLKAEATGRSTVGFSAICGYSASCDSVTKR